MSVLLERASQSNLATCPVCGGAARTWFRPRGEPDGETRFHVCGRCELRFQETAPEEDGSVYADGELATEEALEASGAATGSLLYFDRDALAELRKAAPGSRLLDVGSGDGRFLRAALDEGFAPLGVDISSRLAELARRRSGVEVLAGSLADLRLPPGSFDVVNLDLVLMYVPEPVPLLREIARLLAPGGICRIREYLSDSVNARLKGPRWWMYDRHRLRVYSQQSIRTLADRSELRVLRRFPGTEASFATWREFARRRGAGRLASTRPAFALKRAALLGTLVAADCTHYLVREPGASGLHLS